MNCCNNLQQPNNCNYINDCNLWWHNSLLTIIIIVVNNYSSWLTITTIGVTIATIGANYYKFRITIAPVGCDFELSI